MVAGRCAVVLVPPVPLAAADTGGGGRVIEAVVDAVVVAVGGDGFVAEAVVVAAHP